MRAEGTACGVGTQTRRCEQARAAETPVAPFVALVALCARVHSALCQQRATPRAVRVHIVILVQPLLDRLARPAPGVTAA